MRELFSKIAAVVAHRRPAMGGEWESEIQAHVQLRTGDNIASGMTPVEAEWPTAQSAVGQRIKFGGPYMEGAVVEVIGVAANVSQMGLDGDRVPQMYFPLTGLDRNSHPVAGFL